MKIGQTVRLKSGGPLMTVMGTTTWAGQIVCAWQDKEGKHYKDRFPPETLIKDDAGQQQHGMTAQTKAPEAAAQHAGPSLATRGLAGT
jgi:uncharacterized protein YodC (DUF2158 family)